MDSPIFTRPGDIKLIINQVLPAYTYTNNYFLLYMVESTFVVKPTNQIFETFFVFKSDIHYMYTIEQRYAYFRGVTYRMFLLLSKNYSCLPFTALILTHK